MSTHTNLKEGQSALRSADSRGKEVGGNDEQSPIWASEGVLDVDQRFLVAQRAIYDLNHFPSMDGSAGNLDRLGLPIGRA